MLLIERLHPTEIMLHRQPLLRYRHYAARDVRSTGSFADVSDSI